MSFDGMLFPNVHAHTNICECVDFRACEQAGVRACQRVCVCDIVRIGEYLLRNSAEADKFQGCDSININNH